MLKVVSKSSTTAYRKTDGMRFGRRKMGKIAEQRNTDRTVVKSMNSKSENPNKTAAAYTLNTHK